MLISLLLTMSQVTPDAAAAVPKIKQDEQKIVCQMTSELGTRIPVRVCRTTAQWARIARETEEDMRTSYGFTSPKGTIIGKVEDSRSLVSQPRTGVIVSPRF